MLLRFSVKNHLSIRDTQELSMVATTLKDRSEGLIANPGRSKDKVLPAAVIYGANASGKSNLVLALAFMKEQVLYSHSQGDPNGGVNRNPFALSAKCRDEPTEVEADFVDDGVHYHYGFAANDREIVSEWLYAFPHGTQRKLFERTSPTTIEFGSSLKGKRQAIADLMRSNSLYLSAAAQNGHSELLLIANFFRKIDSNRDISVSPLEINFKLDGSDFDKRSLAFFRNIGTGIVGVEKHEKPINKRLQEFQGKFTNFLDDFFETKHSAKIGSEISELMREEIRFIHKDESGNEIPFDLDRESSGTRRLVVLLNNCFKSLDNGTPIIIDEIDVSLHTQACEAILYLFSDPKINTKGAQLIATTHDTNLLRSPYLRRDQIWLTEKNTGGATELYSLADIKTRGDDNFELGYLQGRYGAVPFTGPVSELFAAS